MTESTSGGHAQELGHGSLGIGGVPAGRYGVLTRAIDASDNIAVARERSLTVKLKTVHA